MPVGIALIGVGLVLVYAGYHGYKVADVVRDALTNSKKAPVWPGSKPNGQPYNPIPPNHAPGSIDPRPVAPGPTV